MALMQGDLLGLELQRRWGALGFVLDETDQLARALVGLGWSR